MRSFHTEDKQSTSHAYGIAHGHRQGVKQPQPAGERIIFGSEFCQGQMRAPEDQKTSKIMESVVD